MENLNVFIWAFVILFMLVELPMFAGGFSVAPWVPTSRKDLERINRLAGLKPGQVFYDIGCGEGIVCSYMARHNPQVKIFGFEIAVPLYLVARLRRLIMIMRGGKKVPGKAKSGVRDLIRQSLQIQFKDMFKVDFSKADVIYFWGTTRGLIKLKNKLVEMKKGAKFITYAIEWPGKKAELVDQPSKGDIPIYVYRV